MSTAPFNYDISFLKRGAQRLEDGEGLPAGQVCKLQFPDSTPCEVLRAYVGQAFAGK